MMKSLGANLIAEASGKGNMGGVEAAPVPLHGRPYSITFTLPSLAAVFFKHTGENP